MPADGTFGPLDFDDTLASTDWSGRFEPFDEKDTAVLELYDGLATAFAEKAFFQTPVRFHFGAEVTLDHAGDDALLSMMLPFRQIWMNDEPARFQYVTGLLLRHTASRTKSETDDFIRHIGTQLSSARKEVLMKDVWQHDPMGVPLKTYNAAYVIDAFMYSGPLHTDEKYAEFRKKWDPETQELTFIKAVRSCAFPIWRLQLIVRAALGDLG